METPTEQKAPILVPVQADSIYINGFAAGINTGDIYVVLQRNGANVGVLNMSYTVAKSLGAALDEIIKSLERRSGREIMTSSDCYAALTKSDEKLNKSI
jgi:hypothetical protein